MFGMISPSEILFIVVVLFLWTWPVWRIVRRAGFPGWIAIFAFIPGINLVLLYFMAFAAWPSLSSRRD
jgi:hypothetical protein